MRVRGIKTQNQDHWKCPQFHTQRKPFFTPQSISIQLSWSFFVVTWANRPDYKPICSLTLQASRPNVCACRVLASFWFRGKLVVFPLFVLRPTPVPLSYWKTPCAISSLRWFLPCTTSFLTVDTCVGIFLLFHFSGTKKQQLKGGCSSWSSTCLVCARS